VKILQVLTYYRPHTSGLTIYVERLSKALAARGHEVTVMTSQFDPTTPRDSVADGVRVVRVPVVLRISKGVIMPTIGFVATRLVREHDVVHLHLPQFDAFGVALRARLFGKPAVLTYHCDLQLPAGLFNLAVNQVVHVMNNLAARTSHRIVTYTQDFADGSPFLRRFSNKVKIILPPVNLPPSDPGAVRGMAASNSIEGRRPIIGMATRFASEKGVELLLRALPRIIENYPQATVLYAGQHEDVLGEQAYFDRLWPTIEALEKTGNWHFLGTLTPAQMAAYYPNLNLLVVPSLNSTESFGLVQIEAMMHGVPVVAANLPGVRQPVTMTGMGEVAEIGDAEDLATKMLAVLDNPDRYSGDPAEIARRFTPDKCAANYEALFESLRSAEND
jgi:glycosyltransferase involved in cell wall biosynthesis